MYLSDLQQGYMEYVFHECSVLQHLNRRLSSLHHDLVLQHDSQWSPCSLWKKEPILPASAVGLLYLLARLPCADLYIKLCFKIRLKI